MRIRDFFIGSFGIFSGEGIPLSKGLSVFWGENESGKTTLLNFFRRILFPREKYSRSRGNSYDPVNGGRLEGTARIEMKDGREYLLSLEGGKNFVSPLGGGAKEVLSGDFFSMTREVYESVFAMGLEDMRSLASLNAAGVAARFFSAGAGLGSASLPGFLARLELMQNDLFRPGLARSTSVVNRLLSSLGDVDGEIRRIRDSAGTWDEKRNELRKAEQAMEARRKELSDIEDRISFLGLMEKGSPSWIAIGEAERELQGLAVLHPFPEDGLARLRRIEEESARIRGVLARTEEAMHSREAELREMSDDPLLACLGSRQEIESLEQEGERFRISLSRKVLLEREKSSRDGMFLRGLENLCPWWTEDSLNSADVSVEAISFARHTAAKKEALERKREEEEKSLAQWNRLRDDRRDEAGSLEKEIAALSERAARAEERWPLLLGLRDAFHGHRRESEATAALGDSLAALESEREKEKGKAPETPAPMILLVSLVLLAVAAGTGYQAWLEADTMKYSAAAALSGAALMAFFAHRDQSERYRGFLEEWKNRVKELESRHGEAVSALEEQKACLEALQRERETLSGRLGVPVPVTEGDLEALLASGEADNEALERRTFLMERRKQMDSILERMDSEGDARRQDILRTEKDLGALLENWRQRLFQGGFDQNLAPRDMEGIIPRILQLRSEKEWLEAREEEIGLLDEYIASVRRRISSLLERCPCLRGTIPSPADPSSIRILGETARRALDKKMELDGKERDMQASADSMEGLKKALEDAEGQKKNLLAEGGSATVEDFRALAAGWKRRDFLNSEKLQEKKVLQGIFGTSESLKLAAGEMSSRPLQDLVEEREDLERKAARLKSELDGIADSKGRLAFELERMASDERLGELLFTRKELEHKMDGAVSEWLSILVARHFLKISKARHERERQPEVIRRAGKFLALMTGTRYTILSSGTEQGLSVVLEESGPSSARKEEIQWSSGLCDQVCLSMRLALATLWGRNSEPMPLVLDDLLVRFDEGRQKGAARAVLEAARDSQVLLFTCQRATLDILRDAAEERGGMDGEPASFRCIEKGKFVPLGPQGPDRSI